MKYNLKTEKKEVPNVQDAEMKIPEFEEQAEVKLDVNEQPESRINPVDKKPVDWVQRHIVFKKTMSPPLAMIWLLLLIPIRLFDGIMWSRLDNLFQKSLDTGEADIAYNPAMLIYLLIRLLYGTVQILYCSYVVVKHRSLRGKLLYCLFGIIGVHWTRPVIDWLQTCMDGWSALPYERKMSLLNDLVPHSYNVFLGEFMGSLALALLYDLINIILILKFIKGMNIDESPVLGCDPNLKKRSRGPRRLSNFDSALLWMAIGLVISMTHSIFIKSLSGSEALDILAGGLNSTIVNVILVRFFQWSMISLAVKSNKQGLVMMFGARPHIARIYQLEV